MDDRPIDWSRVLLVLADDRAAFDALKDDEGRVDRDRLLAFARELSGVQTV